MEIERRRGLPGGRAVLGGVLMAAAAVGVFAAYQGAGDEAGAPVVVATSAIRMGQTVGPDDVRLVEVDLGPSPPPAFHAIDDVVGRVALGPIGEGELLQSGSLTDDAGELGLHEVAITLPRANFAVNRLKPGERVDVYVTLDDQTRTVARSAAVIEITADDGGSLTSSRDVTVIVAVPDGSQVAAIVHALRTGDVTIVRSTFAAEDDASPLTFDGRPEGADEASG